MTEAILNYTDFRSTRKDIIKAADSNVFDDYLAAHAHLLYDALAIADYLTETHHHLEAYEFFLFSRRAKQVLDRKEIERDPLSTVKTYYDIFTYLCDRFGIVLP